MSQRWAGDAGEGTRRMRRDPAGRRMTYHEINSTSGDHIEGDDRFPNLPTEGWVPISTPVSSSLPPPKTVTRRSPQDSRSKSPSLYSPPPGVAFVQVRCPTPTAQGPCNRWQFRVEQPAMGRLEFRCKHCKETTVLWSSEASLPIGLRSAVR
jgi:hypothetical protein